MAIRVVLLMVLLTACASSPPPTALAQLEAELSRQQHVDDLNWFHAEEAFTKANRAMADGDLDAADYWSNAGLLEIAIYQAKIDRDAAEAALTTQMAEYERFNAERLALEAQLHGLNDADVRKSMEAYVEQAVLAASEGAAEYEERLEKQRSKIEQKRRDTANQIQGYTQLAYAKLQYRVATEIAEDDAGMPAIAEILKAMTVQIEKMRRHILSGSWDKLNARRSVLSRYLIQLRERRNGSDGLVSVHQRMDAAVQRLGSAGLSAFYPANALGVEVPLGSGEMAVHTLNSVAEIAKTIEHSSLLVVVAGNALASRKKSARQSDALYQQLVNGVSAVEADRYIVLHNERILPSLAGTEPRAAALIVIKSPSSDVKSAIQRANTVK